MALNEDDTAGPTLDEVEAQGAILGAFWRHPVPFAREILGVQLWSRQEEVLNAIRDNRRVAVKAGNGLGKGFTAASAVLWFICAHNPATVLTTAPTARQVRHVLWRQIHRIYHQAVYPIGGEWLDTRLDISEGRFALGLSTDDVDQFQGFHSPNMLIVVDEAEGVEEPIYEAIEAVMTSENTRLLLIGNPTTVAGTFRRAFYQDRGLYHTITISALESPNVVANRVVLPGLTTHHWVEERKLVWGEDSPIYRARVLGEFPDQSEDTLIPLSWIERAVGRQGDNADDQEGADATLPVILAVDVARFGSDQSVLLVRRGAKVDKIEAYRGLDTMQLTGHVAAAIDSLSPQRVSVDEVGLGAGVVDRLKELGYPVRGINVGRSARHRDVYANLRAEGYWRLRELFSQGAISIPSDSELIGQLSALRYTYNSRGQVIIESKEEARSRGLPSPDRADALMLAFLSDNTKVRLRT